MFDDPIIAGVERPSLSNIEGHPTLIWSGPGVAPLAVVAVFHRDGPVAEIEQPGLAPLRVARGIPERLTGDDRAPLGTTPRRSGSGNPSEGTHPAVGTDSGLMGVSMACTAGKTLSANSRRLRSAFS